MNSSPVPVLYIRLRKRVTIRKGVSIKLCHIAQIMTDSELEKQINDLLIYVPTRSDGNLLMIDIMRVIRTVKEAFPTITIEHFGEPHSLIEITAGEKKPNPFLIAIVWLLLFIGSGVAIMNFHADVSMGLVHQKIYELLTGTKLEHPLLLEIPYSFGIGIGMAVFFNHWFKKKFNDEPSPLEVEMFLYQENMNQYVITEEYNRLHKEQENGNG